MDEIAGHMLTFDRFELNVDAAELRCEGDLVAIEPQVFDLIVYLARHAGRVVSRNELMNTVWKGRVVSDSAVSTGVSAARQALGDDGVSQRLIRTVHGRGFRFEISPQVESTPGTTPSDLAKRLDIRYCTSSDGVSLAYAEMGDGPPLVKAAAYMTHLQHDTEGVMLRHWIEALSREFRFIRYDQRGNGLSDWEVDDVSFEAMVRDLETVVDALDLERFALLGISQGASVSIEYARRHPQRVACLVIFGGYAAGWRHAGNKEFHARREALLELTRAAWDADNPVARQAFATLFMPEGTAQDHAEFNELQQTTTTGHNAYRILSTFADIDVRAALPELRTPTLVMHCRNDAVVPFDAGRQIAKSVPDARFVPLGGNNHVIRESDVSWPRFLEEIRRFVTQHA